MYRTSTRESYVRCALRSLPDGPVTAIHGDLVPPNIHTDAAGRPVAVLDFGFYTTAGDPAFEAAVTAAVSQIATRISTAGGPSS
jgi:aminoglycoside phosphotransferase (APT) family kinase protein